MTKKIQCSIQLKNVFLTPPHPECNRTVKIPAFVSLQEGPSERALHDHMCVRHKNLIKTVAA